MAQQKINPKSGVYDHNTDPSTNYDNNHVVRVGTQNAGNGDPLRTAMLKINEAFDKTDSNFNEVYSALAAAGGDLSAIASDIIPADDNTYNIGSPGNRWKHGYFASGSLYVGDIKLSNDNGRLLVQQVTDAGLITEAPVPNTPGVVTTDRLTNGNKSVTLNSAGTLTLPANPTITATGNIEILASNYVGINAGDYAQVDIGVYQKGGVVQIGNQGTGLVVRGRTVFANQDSTFGLQLDSTHYVSGPNVFNGSGLVSLALTLNRTGTTYNWSIATLQLNDSVQGYQVGDTFAFDSEVHGISSHTVTVTIDSLTEVNPGIWELVASVLNPTVTLAEDSKVEFFDTVGVQVGPKTWLLDTTGKIYLPAGGDIVDSAGTSVLGGSAALGDLKITSSTIGTKDFPDTGGWGGYSLNLDPGGESFSYIQIPSVEGQTLGATLVIANNNTGNGGIRLSVQGGNLIFTDTGIDLPYNLPVRQNNSWTKVTTPLVNIGAGTVVWTSEVNYISSAKLVIQVECSEVGDASGWHSQACEAIIACRGFAGGFGGPTGDPQMIVYGVVHTSVNPLVTFTVQRNPTTKMVEVVGTLTAAAAGAADLRIHSVELSTRD